VLLASAIINSSHAYPVEIWPESKTTNEQQQTYQYAQYKDAGTMVPLRMWLSTGARDNITYFANFVTVDVNRDANQNPDAGLGRVLDENGNPTKDALMETGKAADVDVEGSTDKTTSDNDDASPNHDDDEEKNTATATAALTRSEHFVAEDEKPWSERYMKLEVVKAYYYWMRC
jgi:hypothetical protein